MTTQRQAVSDATQTRTLAARQGSRGNGSGARSPPSFGLQRQIGNAGLLRVTQARLSVSQPDDSHEQEADRVADAVMRMPEPAPGLPQSGSTAVHRRCQGCEQGIERQPLEEEEAAIQAKPLVQPMPLQRQPRLEDEEQRLQPKPIAVGGIIARQPIPEEEEPVHRRILARKPILEEEERLGHRAIARQAIPEEEEPVQRRPIARQSVLEEEEPLQRRSHETNEAGQVSTEVEDAIGRLAGRGAPLPEPARAFMEPRFGADFSAVRIHTDAHAHELARAVNAQAFTVGRDVVFGAGGYRPDTDSGRQLLAHELAHVLQQSAASAGLTRMADGHDPKRLELATRHSSVPRLLQRFVGCGAGEQCPPRAGGELARARTGPMVVGAVTGPYQGLLIGNFAVGSARLKRDLESNPHWAPFWGQMVTNTHIGWEILGFTDCQGGEGTNELLRWERAIAVNNALPRYARSQVVRFRAAPLAECMASNHDEQGRMHNRSAFIRQISTTYWFPEETITRDLPAGPFLDLQIACVIDAGGCSTPRTIAALDRLCRVRTGYRGRPLIQLDLVCSTPGLGIAQSLERAYPGWRSAIPRCPCTRAAAQAHGFSYDLGPWVSNYHPGASDCYRSDPVATMPGTAHRQQCCYDGSGALMVGTAGDGTPDVWDSWGHYGRHQRIDVRPHDDLGYRLYNRYWVPDPGVGCTR